MIRYRLANQEDNEQLIKWTAASGMEGDTSLRIERHPDFFELLNMRGETKVFVALMGDTIIGSICASLQQVYVGGQIFSMQYIGDFKVIASFRNRGVGLQLCNELADYLLSINSDLAFLNVSKGNNKPVSFFKGRPGVPDFDNIGMFNIYQFIGKNKIAFNAHHKIESADVTDEIINFLNVQYATHELGPLITKQALQNTDIFIIRDNNNIIAAMCLADLMDVKQNVVTRLSWKMKNLLHFINALSKISGTSKMPLLNEPVRMLYIKYLAVNECEKRLVRLLVSHACHIVYQKSYSFASIGLHEKDPLIRCFDGMFKLTFNSVGMLLSIKNNKTLIERVKRGIPFEDYSLV